MIIDDFKLSTIIFTFYEVYKTVPVRARKSKRMGVGITRSKICFDEIKENKP